MLIYVLKFPMYRKYFIESYIIYSVCLGRYHNNI